MADAFIDIQQARSIIGISIARDIWDVLIGIKPDHKIDGEPAGHRQSDRHLLQLLYNRLVSVHHEDENSDYMKRFANILNRLRDS